MDRGYFKNLRVDHLKDPVGIDDRRPLFSWQFISGSFSGLSDLRVVVNDANGCIWDSGILEGYPVSVVADGISLQSHNEYFWNISAVSEEGHQINSESARFVTGLFDDKQWLGKWISAGLTHPLWRSEEERSAPYFRKRFVTAHNVSKAFLSICGLGYNETYINGTKITSAVLTPAMSNYDSTSYYNTYEVTDLIVRGKNVIGVILGNGLYNEETQSIWKFECAPWRHHPKFILQLRLVLDNGDEQTIVSDSNFTYTYEGPIIFNALRNGEYYDARREINGWSDPDFDDSKWSKSSCCMPAGGRLRSEQTPLIEKTAVLPPVTLTRIGDKYIADFGQNMSGYIRLCLSGKSGCEITIRYAEKLDADGLADQSNINLYVYSGSFQTDKYIFRGDKPGSKEIWEPRFTYHGFRFAEISGYEGEITSRDICAVVVRTAFESSGRFECSDDMMNTIQKCVLWSTSTNFHSIPTDCPHREKNGWTGDAQLSAEHTMYNYLAYNSYIRWLDDIVDTQRPTGQICSIVPTGGWGYVGSSGPAWDSALIIIPWLLCEFYGDQRIAERYYGPIKKYISYMESMQNDGITAFGLGDWCPPDTAEVRCPVEITDTAYYYNAVRTLTGMAEMLGNKEDQQLYAGKADACREIFISKFITADRSMISNCQTAYACALYFGLAREEDRHVLADKLNKLVIEKDGHLDCGILGTKYILEALCNNGYEETALRIVRQKSYPSWGYCIDQGATTFWETWNGKDSMNHHMFATVGTWFYKYLAGIRISQSGITIKPSFIRGLDWVNAVYESVWGDISVKWNRNLDKVDIEIEVPFGTEAIFEYPVSGKTGLLKGKNVFQIILEDNK